MTNKQIPNDDALERIEREDREKRSGQWNDPERDAKNLRELNEFVASMRRSEEEAMKEGERLWGRERRIKNFLLNTVLVVSVIVFLIGVVGSCVKKFAPTSPQAAPALKAPANPPPVVK